jgi:hypothetical protein
MKELIGIILKNLATYIPVLVSVASKPKRSILELISSETEKLSKALIFVGITLAIGFAFQAPFLQKGQDFTTIVGSMIAFKIFAMLTFPGFILLVFRVLGGKGNYENTLCAYLYLCCPLYLFLLGLDVTIFGIISAHDPELAKAWRYVGISNQQIQEIINVSTLTGLSYLLLTLILVLSQFIWLVICWGIFRNIHQVSWFRSTIAFLITAAAWWGFSRLCILVIKGLHGGKVPPIY